MPAGGEIVEVVDAEVDETGAAVDIVLTGNLVAIDCNAAVLADVGLDPEAELLIAGVPAVDAADVVDHVVVNRGRYHGAAAAADAQGGTAGVHADAGVVVIQHVEEVVAAVCKGIQEAVGEAQSGVAAALGLAVAACGKCGCLGEVSGGTVSVAISGAGGQSEVHGAAAASGVAAGVQAVVRNNVYCSGCGVSLAAEVEVQGDGLSLDALNVGAVEQDLAVLAVVAVVSALDKGLCAGGGVRSHVGDVTGRVRGEAQGRIVVAELVVLICSGAVIKGDGRAHGCARRRGRRGRNAGSGSGHYGSRALGLDDPFACDLLRRLIAVCNVAGNISIFPRAAGDQLGCAGGVCADLADGAAGDIEVRLAVNIDLADARIAVGHVGAAIVSVEGIDLAVNIGGSALYSERCDLSVAADGKSTVVFDGLIDPAVHDGQRAAGVDGDVARSNLLVVKVEDNVLAAIERCIAEIGVARLLENIDSFVVLCCVECSLKSLIVAAVQGSLIFGGANRDFKSSEVTEAIYTSSYRYISINDCAGDTESSGIILKETAVNCNLV